MPENYEGVRLSHIDEQGNVVENSDSKIYKIEARANEDGGSLSVGMMSEGQVVYQFLVTHGMDVCRAGRVALVLNLNNITVLIKLSNEKDAETFYQSVKRFSTGASKKDSMKINDGEMSARGDGPVMGNDNMFDARTEESSAVQYFQFYGYLSQQQNMMQDYIRTSTYQRAMLNNLADFSNKVVIDVGAGSGILSFFAAQAGARKVYAIEASSIAEQCEQLVRSNNLHNKITVIPGKCEEITVPEMADILISEPMGYMLFNERMLETYLHAKKFLKPGGKMFPTQGDLFVAPFTDECLFQEQFSKAHFWYQPNFYGVDLSHLRDAAISEYLRQPIVDTFDYQILLAPPVKHETNFLKCHENDLHDINIPLQFTCTQTGQIHGLAFWFDVAFIGSKQTTWLSTAPTEALTHWYQVRCLLKNPIFTKEGEMLNGHVKLIANTRQSYDVDILLRNVSTNCESSNLLDLKNPLFRYTGQPPQPPPGTQSQSPTESFWGNLSQSNSMNTIPNNIGGSSLQSGAMQNDHVMAAPLTRPVTTQGITSGVAGMTVNTGSSSNGNIYSAANVEELFRLQQQQQAYFQTQASVLAGNIPGQPGTGSGPGPAFHNGNHLPPTLSPAVSK